ncbi:polysaccharide biosynthesis domain containing protein 1 [Cladochytrium tenue]|nr:polysaccharide biosynthesis domain containing protein 1 [Cladochytrium tenue]
MLATEQQQKQQSPTAPLKAKASDPEAPILAEVVALRHRLRDLRAHSHGALTLGDLDAFAYDLGKPFTSFLLTFMLATTYTPQVMDRLHDIRSSQPASAVLGRTSRTSALVDRTLDAIWAAQFDAWAMTEKVAPTLYPSYVATAAVLRMADALRAAGAYSQEEVTSLMDRVRQIEEGLANSGKSTEDPPRGQAVLSSMLNRAHRLLRIMLVQDDEVAEPLWPVLAELRELKAKLSEYEAAHIVSSDGGPGPKPDVAKLKKYYEILHAMDMLRDSNGRFESSKKGPPTSGEALCSSLLNHCFDKLYSLIADMDPMPPKSTLEPIAQELTHIETDLELLSRAHDDKIAELSGEHGSATASERRAEIRQLALDTAAALAAVQERLRKVELLRIDGVFHPPPGVPIPSNEKLVPGQLILSRRLGRCRALYSHVVHAYETAPPAGNGEVGGQLPGETLLPIYERLLAARTKLWRLRSRAAAASPRWGEWLVESQMQVAGDTAETAAAVRAKLDEARATVIAELAGVSDELDAVRACRVGGVFWNAPSEGEEEDSTVGTAMAQSMVHRLAPDAGEATGARDGSSSWAQDVVHREGPIPSGQAVVGALLDQCDALHPAIEQQWAVKALHHAETFFKLISSTDSSALRLTKLDDEIYDDFRRHFPDLQVGELREMEDFKTESAKAKWRDWIMKYEKKVRDFNFGTLLRIRADEDYSEKNSFFAYISRHAAMVEAYDASRGWAAYLEVFVLPDSADGLEGDGGGVRAFLEVRHPELLRAPNARVVVDLLQEEDRSDRSLSGPNATRTSVGALHASLRSRATCHSLLDTDFYKFAMQFGVHCGEADSGWADTYPGIEGEVAMPLRAGYALRDRGSRLTFPTREEADAFGRELTARAELMLLHGVTTEEAQYIAGCIRPLLRRGTGPLDLDALLESYQKRLVAMDLHATCKVTVAVNAVAHGDEPEKSGLFGVELKCDGPWFESIMLEVPMLAMLSETWFRRYGIELGPTAVRGDVGRERDEASWTADEATAVAGLEAAGLHDAVRQYRTQMTGGGPPVVEFGTRRRRSFFVHWLVRRRCCDEPADGAPVSTSNAFFAMREGWPARGTCAHEWFMAHEALQRADAERPTWDAARRGVRSALTLWGRAYGGVYAPTDAFGTPQFLAVIGEKSKGGGDGGGGFDWVELRHDSGDAAAFMDLTAGLGRRMMFSDGLRPDAVAALTRSAGARGLSVSFGVGTSMTNPFGDALDVVIKMDFIERRRRRRQLADEGQGGADGGVTDGDTERVYTFKLSDVPGKLSANIHIVPAVKALLHEEAPL